MGALERTQRWAGFLLVVVASVLIGKFQPARSALVDALTWTRDQGHIGWLVFVVLYVASASVLLPGSVLTLGAGLIFGVALGCALVVPASMIAAILCFLGARRYAHSDLFQAWKKRARVDRFDKLFERSGFRIVLLLRLSPVVPFSLLNYALGLTKVERREYVHASFWGMLPGTLLYVYIGFLFENVTELASGNRPSNHGGPVLYWGGFGLTLATSIALTIIAKRALRDTRAATELEPS